MRYLLLSVLLIVGYGSDNALAKDFLLNPDTPYRWVRRPTPTEFLRYYPSVALEKGVNGRVLLCCTPGANGMLDCNLGSETPKGWGFGEAALQMSTYFKVKLVKPLTSNNSILKIPINFTFGDGAETELYAQWIERNAHVCDGALTS